MKLIFLHLRLRFNNSHTIKGSGSKKLINNVFLLSSPPVTEEARCFLFSSRGPPTSTMNRRSAVTFQSHPLIPSRPHAIRGPDNPSLPVSTFPCPKRPFNLTCSTFNLAAVENQNHHNF